MKTVRITILLMLLAMTWSVAAQQGQVIRGRVTDGRKGIPYATLQLKGTSIGVSCNDLGVYELKIPASHTTDSVQVRSMGYTTVTVGVCDLLRDGRIRLKSLPVELHEVVVSRYRYSLDLMLDMLRRLDDNFQQQNTYSTFFYRDWRSVDDELYLFDEAVMEVNRSAYSQFGKKINFVFGNDRSMESNYKTVLRHRLLVSDRAMLLDKVRDKESVDAAMEYADDVFFYDPVQAPEASYILSERWLRRQHFQHMQEFSADGETYYVVRSTGFSNLSRSTNYEFIIRKRGLVPVRIRSWISKPAVKEITQWDWVKPFFTNRIIEADSSTWHYDVRDDKFTLVRYSNSNVIHLVSRGRGRDGEEQYWNRSVEWTLTDFSTKPSGIEGVDLESSPEAIDRMFGQSDFTSEFWGDYNTIPMDSNAYRLLEKKLKTRR